MAREAEQFRAASDKEAAARRKLEEEMDEFRECGTPRPDWERCAALVDGGEDRWRRLAAGRSVGLQTNTRSN